MTILETTLRRWAPLFGLLLGSALLVLHNALGLAPVVLGFVCLALEALSTGITSEHEAELAALKTRVDAYQTLIREIHDEQKRTKEDLVTLRNHVRPVGGFVSR